MNTGRSSVIGSAHTGSGDRVPERPCCDRGGRKTATGDTGINIRKIVTPACPAIGDLRLFAPWGIGQPVPARRVAARLLFSAGNAIERPPRICGKHRGRSAPLLDRFGISRECIEDDQILGHGSACSPDGMKDAEIRSNPFPDEVPPPTRLLPDAERALPKAVEKLDLVAIAIDLRPAWARSSSPPLGPGVGDDVNHRFTQGIVVIRPEKQSRFT